MTMRSDTANTPWLGTPDDGESSDAALVAEIQAELTELRGICMRFARRLDARAETEPGQADLARLNNSAVKTARAVRQLGVLQLEIAGLREQVGARAAAAPKAANANTPKPYCNGPKPRDYAWTTGDYTEYDDYSDYELEACRRAKMSSVVGRIAEAMYADLRAHGRDDACSEAPADLVDLVRAIPHPALDAVIADIDPVYTYLVFGEGNVRLTLDPASPDLWAAYDARKALDPRSRMDSS